MAQSTRLRNLRWTIVAIHLPTAIARFLAKNEDYGDGIDEFGAKGEVMQLSKKYRKLKSAIWDGIPLAGEQPSEIIDDMIGHLLLLQEQLVSGGEGGGAIFPPEFNASQWVQEYSEAMNCLFARTED